jgi:hypothetical protein
MANQIWHDDDLRGARFTRVDLSDAEFRDVDLTKVRILDAVLVDAELSGLINGLTVNDVEVAPLIQAELDRRYPERLLLRAATGSGLLKGLSAIEDLWRPTLELARSLRPDQLDERVRGEWSIIETLRHLLFVADAWFFHAVVGETRPYHELGLVPAFLEAQREQLGIDPDATPSFENVLELRSTQMLRLRDFLGAVEPSELTATRRGNDDRGYPPPSNHTVLQCLHVVLDEEWNHHQYAARDLARVKGVTGDVSDTR